MIEQLKKELDAVWEPAVPTRPDVLYHYTSADGLRGIIEQGSIFATHATFTNDSLELQHAQPIIRAAFESCRHMQSKVADAVIEPFLENPFQVHRQLDVYVACFSEAPDSLSQWRSYADDGQGYSLGFETVYEGQQHPHCCSPSGVGGHVVDLFAMIYDQKVVHDQLRSQILGFIDVLERRVGSVDQDALAEAVARLKVRVATATIRLKHSGFESEKEWRLTVLADPAFNLPEKCLRVRRGTLVPTVRLPLAAKGTQLPLREIYVGPVHASRGSERAATMGIRHLLRGKCANAESEGFVRISTIPYRH